MTELTLLAHDVRPTGGMERVWWEILRLLPDRSVRLVTAGPPQAERPGSIEEWCRVMAPGRPVSVKFPLYWLGARSLARKRSGALTVSMGAITSAPVDIAHVHFCHAGFQALGMPRQSTGLLRRMNTGVVSTMSLVAERACYRPGRVRLLAAVSRGVTEELRTHFPGVPVRVVPNGIDLERFCPDLGVRNRLRAELGCGRETVLALFVGGEWERKGLHVALESLARMPGGSADIRLVVVGRGDVDRYRMLARRAGVADSVRFAGQQADTAPWYQAADVLVHPSLYETFSLAAHEAAGCGLPVVATPVHGVRELVGDDEAGLLVERTAPSLAAALARVAAAPELRARLGGEARRRAAELTWERTTRAFLEVVAEARAMREREGKG